MDDSIKYQGYGGYGGGYGGDGLLGLVLIAALFGGGRGFGFGGHDGGHGGGCGCDSCCSQKISMVNTNMDSRFNDLAGETRYNSLKDGQFGLAREMGAIGAQLAECCCAQRLDSAENRFIAEKNAWTISKQISDCLTHRHAA
jgi:hypothetical protein